MKRIVIMLLIACSALSTISAEPSASAQKKPDNVIATLNAIVNKFGLSQGQVYSVNRNPNTGIIESSIKIFPFCCSANAMKNDNVLRAVALNFPKDEPLSYQFLHIQPGSNENFEIKIITDNDTKGTQRIRTSRQQEMWFMCCKNPENPQLRDAYAIVWENMNDQKDQVVGTIYMITSLRPDVYEKTFQSSKRMFKIVGRVDDEIKDSLYNIYIADTRNKLYALEDHEYVACVPVVNKRFEYQIELDKPCVGRLRCIFPDGSLCSAWIDLDFVPGETYNITVHNGYYDEDKDYERRVGRQSGKSLIEPDAVKVVEDTLTLNGVYYKADPEPDDFRKWRKNLSQQQEMQLNIRAERIQMDMEKLGKSYDMIKMYLKGTNDGYMMDVQFKEILKQNQELEAKWQDAIKFFKANGLTPMAYPKVLKEIIEVYTGQLRELDNYFKQHGTMSKTARKVNSYVIKQNEKYMDAIQKSFD